MEISEDGFISWLPEEIGSYGPITLVVSDGGENNAPPALQSFTIYVEQTTEITTTYSVSEGANLISFYGIPIDNSISNVLTPVNDFAEGIIGEGIAATQISPGFWVGSLSYIEQTSGYWLLVGGENNASYDFSITAPPPDTDIVYNIQEGANLISYIGIEGLEISEAFPDDIEYNISGLIGEGVAATQIGPEFWVGSLAYFEQRKGYWLLSDASFDYSWEMNYNFIRSELSESDLNKQKTFNFKQSSKQAFYFIESLNIEKDEIDFDDWLLAYCNNTLVGSRKWNGIYTDIPVMGNDEHNNTESFCTEGDMPSFKLYDFSLDEYYNLDADNIPAWSNNKIFLLNSLTMVNYLPEQYLLNKPYPNPFNPNTTINFSIPIDSYLSIIIYDIKGQQVDILYDNIMKAGYHDIIWNGDGISSGMYFINMISGKYNSTQKIILLK